MSKDADTIPTTDRASSDARHSLPEGPPAGHADALRDWHQFGRDLAERDPALLDDLLAVAKAVLHGRPVLPEKEGCEQPFLAARNQIELFQVAAITYASERAAARALGVPRTTFNDYLRRYGRPDRSRLIIRPAQGLSAAEPEPAPQADEGHEE